MRNLIEPPPDLDPILGPPAAVLPMTGWPTTGVARPVRRAVWHRHEERISRETEHYSRAVLDSLSARVTVLDGSGAILAVNRAWRDFARGNAPAGASVAEGANYLRVCDEATGEDAETGRAFAAAIRDVLAGRRAEFTREYPCHAPGQQRWFVGRVTSLDGDGPRRVVVAHDDVTERKRTEEALRRSESRLQAVLDHVPAAIFLKDLDGRYLLVNRCFAELFGVTEREAVGKTDFDFLPEDVAGTFRANDRRALEAGGPVEVEEVARYVDGPHTSIVVKVPLLDDDGNPFAVCGIATDITERKRAEQALREREEQIRLLLDSTGEAIYGIGLDGLCTFCNAACLRLLGYADPSDLIGRSMHGLTHHTRADGTPHPLEDCRIYGAFLRGVGTHVDDEVLWRADGTCFPAEYWSYPMRQGEQVVGAVVTFVDITGRKRAEEALRRSEERLRLALAAGRMGTWDWDIRTNEVICSEDVEALHGLPPGCFDGTLDGFRRLIHPAHRGLVDRAIDRAISEGSEFEVEYRVNRPDGSFGWMSSRGRVLSEDGQPSRMIGVGMDVTQRKRNEDEIFALNAELEGRLERLHALRAIDRAVTGSLDLPFTLGVVLDQAMGRLEVDAAAILLCRPHEVSLEYAAKKGYRAQSPVGATQRLDAGPAGRAVLEGRTQHVADAADVPESLPESTRAEGFVAYWAVPLVAKGQVRGVLEVGHRSSLEPDPEWLEFLEALAGQAAIAVENAELFEGLRRSNLELTLAYDATIEGWSRAMDLRDHETEGHSRRVTDMTLRLARSMGIGEAELVHVRRGALLHDIGKIGIPDAILLKPGKLTEEEFAIIRRHPEYAWEMLAPITFLRPALDIPYCHHEKWDGTGYPRGLGREHIPLVARIFASVDIWDALSSDRPYRKGWPREKVHEHLRSLSGTHLDPAVVEAFLRCMPPPAAGGPAPDIPT
jgi:PAS domain S-box-containing protein